jgi:hypothetical protein
MLPNGDGQIGTCLAIANHAPKNFLLERWSYDLRAAHSGPRYRCRPKQISSLLPGLKSFGTGSCHTQTLRVALAG